MSQPQTYFVIATIEVCYQTFCADRNTAVKRFEEALLDDDERACLLEDAYSMYTIKRIETADKHLGRAE